MAATRVNYIPEVSLEGFLQVLEMVFRTAITHDRDPKTRYRPLSYIRKNTKLIIIKTSYAKFSQL
jgi:hypothetical protein